MEKLTLTFNKYNGNLTVEIDGKVAAIITLEANLFALGGFGNKRAVVKNDNYQVSDLVIDYCMKLYHAVKGNIISEVSD